MATIKCPGQDRSFWKPEDIYNVTCARCGRAVEFFRTDGSRRCPGCQARITNPKLVTGCAQWCKHAIACLGYDPNDTDQHPEADPEHGPSLLEKLEAIGKRGREDSD
jgi:hypothetical protein